MDRTSHNQKLGPWYRILEINFEFEINCPTIKCLVNLIMPFEHYARWQHKILCPFGIANHPVRFDKSACVYEERSAHALWELFVFYELNKKGRISLNRIAVPPPTNCTPETLQNTNKESCRHGETKRTFTFSFQLMFGVLWCIRCIYRFSLEQLNFSLFHLKKLGRDWES